MGTRLRQCLSQGVERGLHSALGAPPRFVNSDEGTGCWSTPAPTQSVELGVQRLNVTVNPVDGGSCVLRGSQNSVGINGITSHGVSFVCPADVSQGSGTTIAQSLDLWEGNYEDWLGTSGKDSRNVAPPPGVSSTRIVPL